MPELESISLLTLGGKLEKQQKALLRQLMKEPKIHYEQGIPDSDCEWIRPLRNAGLIQGHPEDVSLQNTKSLELTPLGDLVARSIGRKPPSNIDKPIAV